MSGPTHAPTGRTRTSTPSSAWTRTPRQAEIKKAYRKLARANHPDSNPGDTAKHEKFKAVAEAYDVVGDAEKRKKYDEMRRLYGGGGFRGGFPGGVLRRRRPGSTSTTCCATGAGGFGDLFGDIFGGRRRRRRTRTRARPVRGADVETERDDRLHRRASTASRSACG